MGEASCIAVAGVAGSIGFLNHHAPLITMLKAGDVKLKTDPVDRLFPMQGGAVEVLNNTVVALAEYGQSTCQK